MHVKFLRFIRLFFLKDSKDLDFHVRVRAYQKLVGGKQPKGLVLDSLIHRIAIQTIGYEMVNLIKRHMISLSELH